jgi:hypothetical protein
VRRDGLAERGAAGAGVERTPPPADAPLSSSSMGNRRCA